MMRPLAVLLLGLCWFGAAWAGPSQIQAHARFYSPALGRFQPMAVYLPPDLASHPGPLPVIYLLHGVAGNGVDWISSGHVQAAADALIAAHRLPPVLIVMPDAGNSWYVDSAKDGAMATAIGRDLPAWIERHYPAGHRRGDRAIAGNSMGGFGALRLAVLHPQQYAAVAAMSGAWWSWLTPQTPMGAMEEERASWIFAGAFGTPFNPARFVAASPTSLLAAEPRRSALPAIYLTCGRQDRFKLNDEQAVIAHRLDALGIPYEAHLTDGDHDWDTWSASLPDVLEFLGRHLTGHPRGVDVAAAIKPNRH